MKENKLSLDRGIGLRRGVVQLLKHDSEWNKIAEGSIQKLKAVFKSNAVDVQHIGSTAIDFISAKPIIDIAVGVNDFECLTDDLLIELSNIGVIISQGQPFADIVLFSKDDNGLRTHNIQVVKHNGVQWSKHIAFRDYLSLNKEKAIAYEQLKLDLAKKFPNDVVSYSNGKSAFIEDCIAVAQKHDWILFDVGYTLVNEEEVWKQRCSEQAKTDEAQKLSLSAENIYNEVVNASKNFLPQYRTVVKKYGFKEVAPYRHEFEQLYEGVDVILAALSKKYKLAIIANQEAGLVDRLNKWGIDKYFSKVFSSYDCGYLKPDIRLFEAALSKLGCLSSQCIMVGDRIDNDIIPAKSIGMKTIWVKQGLGAFQMPRSKEEMPDFEVESIADLLFLVSE